MTKSLKYSEFSKFDRQQIETAIVQKNILEVQCQRITFTKDSDLVNTNNSFCSYVMGKVSDISLVSS